MNMTLNLVNKTDKLTNTSNTTKHTQVEKLSNVTKPIVEAPKSLVQEVKATNVTTNASISVNTTKLND